jgi:hypothetical protein
MLWSREAEKEMVGAKLMELEWAEVGLVLVVNDFLTTVTEYLNDVKRCVEMLQDTTFNRCVSKMFLWTNFKTLMDPYSLFGIEYISLLHNNVH